MIFLHMMSIKDFQIDENFSVENDSEFENVRFGRDAIDRVISSLGGKPVLQILSHYILKLIQMTDWRFPFSALMGLSQVGEYLDEVEEIEGSVEVTLGFIINLFFPYISEILIIIRIFQSSSSYDSLFSM